MNVLGDIGGAIDALWQSFGNIWDSLLNIGLDGTCYAYKEVAEFGINLLNTIPMPAALTTFQWPEAPGLVGTMILECGVPEGMAILAAGFTVRMLLKLTVIFN